MNKLKGSLEIQPCLFNTNPKFLGSLNTFHQKYSMILQCSKFEKSNMDRFKEAPRV